MRVSRIAMAAAVCALAVGLSGSGQRASAQEDGPPPAFAGGQMVRGTVTAVSPAGLTLKTEAGETFQVVVTPSTQVRKGREQMKLADVHPGDGAGAMGVLDPATKTVHAMAIAVMDAEQIRKAREALGKTWIAGKVTAIDADALKLTVQREDGVSQVIGLDDGTSFKRGGRGMGGGGGMMGGGMMGGGGGGGQRRNGGQGNGQQGGGQPGGGESITLADVKVGDVVGGPGALKGGVFIPTELRVADPTAPRRRRPADGSGPPPAGSDAGTTAGPKA